MARPPTQARQTPLFPEAVEGGLLPPLHLLEPAPPQTDRVSPETLEYTSRLIERKLADFGVQAAVLAAYPGPVITRYEIEPAVGVKVLTYSNGSNQPTLVYGSFADTKTDADGKFRLVVLTGPREPNGPTG